MDSEGNEIILIGDFNCDWSLEKDKLNSQTNKLVDLANLFQLEQFIKQPTRLTQMTRTIIDLPFSNRPEIVLAPGVEHLGITDHSLIYICRKISIPHKEPKLISTQQFKNYSKDAFCYE
jgi:hypothetical protein